MRKVENTKIFLNNEDRELAGQLDGWQPFDYDNPPAGTFWVRGKRPISDCDVDDCGALVGWHTGEWEDFVAMATVDGDYIQGVATCDFGYFFEDDLITHYKDVMRP